MTRTNGNGDGATAVHIALQGKGGVGKRLVSAILSQYLSSKGQDVLAIDAEVSRKKKQMLFLDAPLRMAVRAVKGGGVSRSSERSEDP